MSHFCYGILTNLLYPQDKKNSKMQEDFNAWVTSIQQSNTAVAIALVSVLTVLRGISDSKEYRGWKVVAELITAICMLVMASKAVTILGVSQEWMVIIGGLIGIFGTVAAKELAIKFLRSKIPPPKNRRDDDTKK